MISIRRITNPLERRRLQYGYSQMGISKLLGITQSQYSRIEKGETSPDKHLKKLSEIFNCKPNEVLIGDILKEIDDEFLNEETNVFARTYHDRKPGYVNLKVNGWFTKKQIIQNYKMILEEMEVWNIREDGIRWRYKFLK